MAVSSYVGTMLGTEPPNPKEPQGSQQVRQAPAPADETGVASEAEATESEPAAS
jgi:hypothetical protein